MASTTSGTGEERGSVEKVVLTALACLLVTYAVISLRMGASLPSPLDSHRGQQQQQQLRVQAQPRTQKDQAQLQPQSQSHVRKPSLGAAAPAAISSGSTASFPISVKDQQYERILHPAFQLINHHKPNSNPRSDQTQSKPGTSLDVPKFWDPAQYGSEGGIRQHLGQHGKRLITPSEAAEVGTYYTKVMPDGSTQQLETIYVAISSYRDWQCTGTVENVFYRAKHPERVRVAVVDQIDEGDAKCGQPAKSCNADPDQILCRHADQIDVYSMDATLAVGPVFARHIGHRMYRGEYFGMQCDAHVKFTQDWDADIIEQWMSARNEMAVLTAYLSDIQGAIDEATGRRLHESRPIMCRTDYEGFGDQKHLRHGQQPEGKPGIHGEPTIEPYWAAGYSFARGHFVVQVPYDQYLPQIFQGEEISIGLRGWTYGYDYYTPEKSVCFHMYAVGKNKSKRKKVKLFWEHSNLYQGVGSYAMLRLLGIISMSNPGITPDQWFHDEEEKYGTGNVRTLDKFFTTFGIHHEKQKIEQHLCRFVGAKMQKEFIPHLRKDRMGINYDTIDYEFVDPAPDEKPPPLNGNRSF